MKIEEAVDLIKSGLQKFHRFNNQGAYVDFSKILSAYPKNGSASYWLGCALFNMYLDNGRQRKHLFGVY
jgi:TolA-binding protein